MANSILLRIGEDSIDLINLTGTGEIERLSESECLNRFGEVPPRETSPRVERINLLANFLKMNFDEQSPFFGEILAKIEAGTVKDLYRTQNIFMVEFYDGGKMEFSSSNLPNCRQIPQESKP